MQTQNQLKQVHILRPHYEYALMFSELGPTLRSAMTSNCYFQAEVRHRLRIDNTARKMIDCDDDDDSYVR